MSVAAWDMVDDDSDLNDLLEPVAMRAGTTWGLDALDFGGDTGIGGYGADESLGEALAEAAVHFDETRHPRWPKGTPRGGEFVRVGQAFAMDGKNFQVAHVVADADGGKVYAHLAGGNEHGTIEVHATKTAGFQPSHPKSVAVLHAIGAALKTPIKGGKSQGSTVTAISPYVDSSTHDPSIPMPPHSHVTAEQWKRFGKLDQEHYTELQERFGQWSPNAAKPLVDAAYQKYDTAVQQAVKKGYSDQYYQSTGLTLSLVGAVNSIKHLFKKDKPEDEEFRAVRERAMELQGEHRAAVQWDLYNSTKSPDVTAFHKDDQHNTSFWDQMIHGGPQSDKVFSGLSQTWYYDSDQFGDTCLCTPLAIRHVLLATQSAQPIPGEEKYINEREISVPEQMVLDDRSVAFTYHQNPNNGNKLSPPGRKWLASVTQSPAAGTIAQALVAHFKNGEALPDVPIQAEVQLTSGKGQAWKDPDPSAWAGIEQRGYSFSKPAKDMEDGEWFLKDGTTYAVAKQADGSVVGSPISGESITISPDETYPVAQPAKTAGLSPGDYIQGLQGSRYIVVADPSDPTGYGLRRVEGTNQGQIHGKSFTFSGGGVKPFFRLEGHYAAPKTDDAAFDPAGWTFGAEPVKVKDMKPGTKLKVDGLSYEITGQTGGSVANIKSLDSGETGTMNAWYSTHPLVPKKGYTPPAGSVIPEQPAPVEPAKPKPEPGDIVAYSGEKYVVTGTLASGKVKIKRPGKPGIVVLAPDDPAFDHMHRPSDYAIGPKAKLRDIPVGGKFQMGAGTKQKPYEVVAHGGPGKPTVVRDLSTGKVLDTSRNTSYAKLVPATMTEPTATGIPKSSPQAPDAPHDPTAYVLGDLKPLSKIGAGGKFRSKTGKDFQIIGPGEAHGSVEVKALYHDSTPFDVTDQAMHHELLPKASNPTPYENLTAGDATMVEKLKAGDQFKGTDGGLFQMTHVPDDPEGTYMAASVYGDGMLGANQAVLPSQGVTFHAHAAQAAAAPTNGFSVEPLDPAALPTAPGFQGYSSGAASGAKASGGYSGKHDKISMMAVGTVFRDKTGKHWKVKASGADPIITDGEKNYSVPGHLRGRASTVMTELPQGDHSPAIGTPGVDDVQAAQEKVMKANTSISLGQLSPGDLFQADVGKPILQVASNDGYSVHIVNPKTGLGGQSEMDFIPKFVALSHPLETEPAAKASRAVPAPYAWVAPTEGTPAGKLKVGDAFTDANGDLHAAAKVDAAGIVTAVSKHGEVKHIGPSELVGAPSSSYVHAPAPDEPANIVGELVHSPSTLQPGDVVGGGKHTWKVAAVENHPQNSTGDVTTVTLETAAGNHVVAGDPQIKHLKLVSQANIALPSPPAPPEPNKVGAAITNPHGLVPGDVLGQQAGSASYTVKNVDEHGVQLLNKTGDTINISHASAKQMKLKALASDAPAESTKPPEVGDPWAAELHQEGPWKQVGDFDLGEVFKGAKGGYHQIIGQDPSGIATVKSLKTGTVYQLKHSEWRKVQVPKTPLAADQAEAAAEAGGASAPKGIPDYDHVTLSGGTAAGGSTGAQIKTAEDGTKFLLKTYAGNEDRVATELLANSVYREMGAKVADAGTYTTQDGKTALAYPLLDGKPHAIEEPSAEIGKHFMTDALVANYDFIGLTDDNILWDKDGKPFRVDQGGTFQFRAQGKPKDYGDVPSEVWTMFEHGQAKGKVVVSPESKRAQAAEIAKRLTPERVDQLVGQAPFADKQMKAEVASALKARVAWMADYAKGKNLEPGQPPVAPNDAALNLPTPKAVAEPSVQSHAFQSPGLEPSDQAPSSPQEDAVAKITAKYGTLTGVPPAPDFSPFKSPSGTGGAYKHPKLSQLSHGQEFVDKTGTAYTFVAASKTEAIIVSKTGGAHRVPIASRVKLKGTGGA